MKHEDSWGKSETVPSVEFRVPSSDSQTPNRTTPNSQTPKLLSPCAAILLKHAFCGLPPSRYDDTLNSGEMCPGFATHTPAPGLGWSLSQLLQAPGCTRSNGKRARPSA